MKHLRAARPVRGEMVATFIFDLGGEVHLDRVQRILGETPEVAVVEPAKAAPKYVALPRPLAARFKPVELSTSDGPLKVAITVRIYALGAAAVRFRFPFEEQDLMGVRKYLNLQILDGGQRLSLTAYAARFYAPVRASLSGAVVEPYTVEVEPEGYSTIVLTEPPCSPQELMRDHRATLAALLDNAPEPEKLSRSEVEDNMRFWYTYYEDDLVLVDWDYSLIVDKPGQYEDVLFIMELANLQLLELRTYDAYLDRVLEKAYADLDRYVSRSAMLSRPAELVKELSEARIDLARVTDGIENIGKLFGDYYLAKVYLGLAERFHIWEWEHTVNEKLRTLNELYAMAAHEVETRRGLTLELLIVLLFVIDLVILAVTLKP